MIIIYFINYNKFLMFSYTLKILNIFMDPNIIYLWIIVYYLL